MISITSNAMGVHMDMRRSAARVQPAFRAYLRQSALELQQRVRWYASGHGGGPNYITGDYYNSIQRRYAVEGSFEVAYVGTDMERGLLLEEGGTVSGPMGDIRTIAPHPHFAPAWTERINKMDVEILKLIDSIPIGVKGKSG